MTVYGQKEHSFEGKKQKNMIVCFISAMKKNTFSIQNDMLSVVELDTFKLFEYF